jgi:hypothetical protein
MIIEIWSNKGKTANKENFKGKVSYGHIARAWPWVQIS